ncbi:hypothetical protein QE152_g40918 [Popillia japonica]|uniref:Uncharacterized protein n=1 Tax=Popillia japonica TaxID=7064 RepID=A0AAW1HF59_POPJA
MTNKTSAGDDEISSFLLKNIIYELAEHLAYLINSSFAEGRFPDSWKTATVVPIYKRGSQIDVASYRPISTGMTNKTSAGDDEISSFLLKNIIYELAEHLAYLINSSFSEGRFPDSRDCCCGTYL